MNKAYVALGTNIEPRETYLKQAMKELSNEDSIHIISESSIYQTAPVGYLNQADFLNMVIEVKTTLLPIELLDKCQDIEQNLGRERGIRFGPRTIDLDILLFNEEDIHTERLRVPHPRMHERAFVLVPLSEVAPEQRIPALNRTVTKQVNQLAKQDLQDVKKWHEEDK